MARRSKGTVLLPGKVSSVGIGLTVLGTTLLVLPMVVSNPTISKALEVLGATAKLVLLTGVGLLVLGRLLAKSSPVGTEARQLFKQSPVSARTAAASSPPGAVPAVKQSATPKAEMASRRAASPGGLRTASAVDIELTAQLKAASVAAPTVRPQRWGKDVFDVIEWRRFEAVVERLFQQAGFQTKSQSHGADDGVDIWLYSQHQVAEVGQGGQPVSVVQCKHWRGRRVGVDKVRELRGVMASRHVKRGQFVTTSTFTADAVDFARRNAINLLDAEGLLALIATRSPPEQAELLAVALEGDYWRPTCVNCGVKLAKREPANGRAAFWGCANFPTCRTTMAMRAG